MKISYIQHPIYLLLLVSTSLFSMHNAKKIDTAIEFSPFAGKVVAYTTTSCYFGKSEGYPIIDHNKYGYINPYVKRWSSNEDGLELHQLLLPNEVPGSKALVDSEVKGSNLFMRKVTTQEAVAIIDALTSNKANLDYNTFKKEALKVLQDQIQEK